MQLALGWEIATGGAMHNMILKQPVIWARPSVDLRDDLKLPALLEPHEFRLRTLPPGGVLEEFSTCHQPETSE
jgi:hypothetical protein